VLGNLIESWVEIRPSIRAFSTSFSVMAEVTQLVAAFDFPLAMAFLFARCFTRIYQIYAWGLCTKGERSKIDNGGGGGEKELVNSKIPHDPPYISSGRRIVG
jgi:hypothetical protein